MRGGVMTRRKMVRIHPPAPIGRLIAAPTGCGASDEKEQPLSQPAADSSPYTGEPGGRLIAAPTKGKSRADARCAPLRGAVRPEKVRPTGMNGQGGYTIRPYGA